MQNVFLQVNNCFVIDTLFLLIYLSYYLPLVQTSLVCNPGVDLLGMTFCPESAELDKDSQMCCKTKVIYCAPPLELNDNGVACPDTHPYNEEKKLCCGDGSELLNQNVAKNPSKIASKNITLSKQKKKKKKRLNITTISNLIRTQLPSPRQSACFDMASPGRLSDCPLRRNLCKDSQFAQIMRSQCPRTCGYCYNRRQPDYRTVYKPDFSSSNENLGCIDKMSKNGVNECPLNKLKCLSGVFRRFMKAECPVTCGYCKRQRYSSNFDPPDLDDLTDALFNVY